MDKNYDYSYTQNRELSWLNFNQRVLKEAEDHSVPLLERLKFLAIYQSNLDEFFMIRVGSLTDLSLLKKPSFDNKSGLSTKQQLEAIYATVNELTKRKDRVYHKLNRELSAAGIEHYQIKDLDTQQLKVVEQVFRRDVFPLLSPIVLDMHHPFPHLLNKQKVVIANVKTRDRPMTMGIIPISDNLPKMIRLPKETLSYLLIEDVVMHFFPFVFKQYQVSDACVISVTRNADVHPEDEVFDFDVDFRIYMKQILKKRNRLAPVRLEVSGTLDERLKKLLKDKLKLSDIHISMSSSPLTFDHVFLLIDQCSMKQKSELLNSPYTPAFIRRDSKKQSVMETVFQQDICLSYPYDDVDVFLQLLKESAQSPEVISIKITLYRLATNSKVIQYLVEAAENGKEVTVMIELRARFDERHNIDNAEILEKAGCNLLYGFEEYKVHAKCLLITMMRKQKLSYITQIGTGNYNERTANIYADFSLITANEQIAQDVNQFFKNMAMANLNGAYRHLWVAPTSFKSRIMDGMDEQIARAKQAQSAYLLFKCNSLTDRDIIDKLMEASCAGVKVDLIIRGISCLLPNIPNKTENIRIISVVGRFLEHARVYGFGEYPNMNMVISSGDLMTRSTTRRVEVAVVILDKNVKEKIYRTLTLALKDNVKAYQINRRGKYQRVKPESDERVDSQKIQMQQAMTEVDQEVVVKEKQVKPFKRIMMKIFDKKR